MYQGHIQQDEYIQQTANRFFPNLHYIHSNPFVFLQDTDEIPNNYDILPSTNSLQLCLPETHEHSIIKTLAIFYKKK